MANRVLDAVTNAVEVADQEAKLWFSRMSKAEQDGDDDSASKYEAKRDHFSMQYHELRRIQKTLEKAE